MAEEKMIYSVAFRDVSALRAAAMPFLEHGGLFIQCQPKVSIGEEVLLLLYLPDRAGPVCIEAKVVWLTPERAQGGRQSGIGVQFFDKHTEVMRRIKELLSETRSQSSISFTM